MVSYNSQICSHADDLYLLIETADEAEVNLPFVLHVKAWRTLSYYCSMHYYYYYCIQCWMEVSGEFDTGREIFCLNKWMDSYELG